MDMTNEQITERLELCNRLAAAEQQLINSDLTMTNDEVGERLHPGSASRLTTG